MDRPRNSEPKDPWTAYERRFFHDEKKEEETVKKPPEKPKNEDTKDKKPKLEPEVKKEEKKEKEDKKETKKKPLTPEEKQEKRVEVVERCETYKKQFEDMPIPRDPTTVARLIVAEHILTLNEELHQPEAAKKPGAKKELEEALDYMCLLAEKFEDPSVEYPPEIEDTYDNLVALATEALDETDQPELLVEEIAQAVNGPAENPMQLPAVEKAAGAPPTIQNEAPSKASTMAAIAALLSKGKTTAGGFAATTQPVVTPQARSLPNGGGFASRTSSYSGSAPRPAQAYTSGSTHIPRRDHTAVAKIHRPPETMGERREIGSPKTIVHPLAAVALAGVVAAKIHKSPEISHRHEYASPIHYEAPREVSSSQPKLHHQSHEAPHPTARSEFQSLSTARSAPNIERPLVANSYEPSAAHHSESPAPSSNRKLEHMTLQSLLTLAHNVPVGHGRYLKTEFEQGRIDKAGLIKVLKARKKGLDFFREYKKQSADFQLRRISPEFLTQRRSVLENDDGKSSPDAPTSHEKSELATSEKTTATHPLLERYSQPEKSLWQAAPKNNTRIQVILAIIATLIFTFIILSFFIVS